MSAECVKWYFLGTGLREERRAEFTKTDTDLLRGRSQETGGQEGGLGDWEKTRWDH